MISQTDSSRCVAPSLSVAPDVLSPSACPRPILPARRDMPGPGVRQSSVKTYLHLPRPLESTTSNGCGVRAPRLHL